MKETVSIIGSHPRTRGVFDFNRTDCDVWAFNEAISNKTFPRADVVFQMHVPTIWRNPKNRNDPKHYEWLKAQNDCIVMMQDVYEDVPHSFEYPLSGILDMLNGDPDHFLSSSVPQAIALAVFQGYHRIEIYGVAMETNTEWQFQREGVSFWKGFAMGRGIEVTFADETFRCPLYGYEGAVTVEYVEFDKRVTELASQIADLSRQYIGNIHEVKKAVELLIGDGSKDIENALYAIIERQIDLGKQLGVLDGARQENQRYKGKADTMKQADGGNFIFSRQEFESGAKTLTDKMNSAQTEFIALGTQLGNAHRAILQAAKGSPKRKKYGEAFFQVLKAYLDTNNKQAVYRGAAQENYSYMAYLDKHIRAAGGAKSEAVLLESMAEDVRA